MNLPEFSSKIIYNEDTFKSLVAFIKTFKASNIFILTDTNTNQHCSSYFLSNLETTLAVEVLEIEAGEQHKNIETCFQLWEAMANLGADKKTLLINLGGGVLTDLGGFLASTYKRGISFINIPTTLLAMVDAAIGGKTGVNLGNLKNQVGVINPAKAILIDPSFLATLPPQEMRSGLAEMLKHGLIYDAAYWNKLSALNKLTTADLMELIKTSIEIKTTIVAKDLHENNLRKVLNYGHTLGHAIESYCFNHPNLPKLLHGEAIAIGMILEAYLSVEIASLSKAAAKEIKHVVLQSFPKITFTETDIENIYQLLQHDKKNSHGNIQFVLLEAIGKPVIDCNATFTQVKAAFDFYNS